MQDGPEEGSLGVGPWSFILRIWLEQLADEAGPALWRGHITHVPSGERRYVQTPQAILAVIGLYLREAGVPFDPEGQAAPDGGEPG